MNNLEDRKKKKVMHAKKEITLERKIKDKRKEV